LHLDELRAEAFLSECFHSELVEAEKTKADEIARGARYGYDELLRSASAEIVKRVCGSKTK
jgi:hypothetical protein